MLFLKSIWAHGFKSFAEPTKIEFNEPMTGVVGPNGSGKSNITDAIKWALGEQSNKTLRGKKMDDIVFAGSANKKALSKAIVKLTFNNEKGVFSKYDTDIVEITRTYDKDKRESEFFINGDQVRLRDIQDAALETGLTKSSLAIISQGTIENFAGAKPEDRRELFNEAAGVAKYKKRKEETLVKLIKTQENLNRVSDIATEINKRLPGLEKAANKAKLYEDKFNRLKEIEVNILAKDGKIYRNRLVEILPLQSNLKKQIEELQNKLDLVNAEFRDATSSTSDTDVKVADLTNQFNELIKRISDLKVRLNLAEQNENNSLKDQSEDTLKTSQLEKEFASTSQKINDEQDRLYKLKSDEEQQRTVYDDLENRVNDTYHYIDQIRVEINKIEAKIEYLQKNVSVSSNYTINTFMKNSSNIRGVVGPLIGLINVDQEYQEAIGSATGNSLYSVVMQTNNDTKKAAEFVRNNNIGKITFLPLDTINPSTFNGVRRNAIEQSDGFIGFANELVTIDSKYQAALDYALGNIIVVDNYDDGRDLSMKMGQTVNIVTLQGDRFLPKGGVVAGKNRNQSNLFSNQNSDNVETLQEQIEALDTKENEFTKQWQSFKIERDKVKDVIAEINVKKGTINNSVNDLRNKLQDINDQYQSLTGHNINESAQANNGETESVRLNNQISKLTTERDDIQREIQSINEQRSKNSAKQNELAQQNEEFVKKIGELKDEQSELRYEDAEIRNRLDAFNERLVEKYNITIDSAIDSYEDKQYDDEDAIRKELLTLKDDLKDIGNVDINSIGQYETEKERSDYYAKELSDIQAANDSLQAIIDEMDGKMIAQFSKVIDDVNEVLPTSFSRLFGGGTAHLSYTDPDDILNTGIEIEVNPPGKKISNINLLSGGEKSLVALSVLFSILKVRPLPLVILDEAEAPLDPSNVERFAKYIREFTNNTQFIVVTHREGTMENCDVLFGVTMENKGITKIVKIKLYDAKQLAEQGSNPTSA